MTEKEKQSLKIRLGKCFSNDKRRVMEIVKREIDKTPVTETKKGKWIKEIVVEEPRKNKRAYARCSSCGRLYNHYLVAVKHFDFCPKCGARMKEGDEK